MTNRQQRRAEKASSEFPDLPPFKNVSGTDQCCGNCPKRANEKAWGYNMHLDRKPKPADDIVLCLAVPGGGTVMKRWGWCALWGPPVVQVKIVKDEP